MYLEIIQFSEILSTARDVKCFSLLSWHID